MQQIQLKDEGTGIILAATVRPEFEDGQPRVRDLDLGEWLGYERPNKVRELIRRNMPEIEALGRIPTVGIRPEGGGPQATEYWLTEEQAIAVCQLSQTPRAAAVRTMLRRMFVEYRKGSLVAVTSDAVVKLGQMDVMLNAIANLAVTVDRVAVTVERGFQSVATQIEGLTDHVSDLSRRMGVVESVVNQSLKDPRPGDLALMANVVARYYQGRCPCCEKEQILDASGAKTPAWTVDHTNGAADNRLSHLWPVCCAISGCGQWPDFALMGNPNSPFQKRVGLASPQQLRLSM